MRRIALLLTDDFEDSEAARPLAALRDSGEFEVRIVSPEGGKPYTGKKGDVVLTSDIAIANTHPEDYAGLVIPGGHSPEKLRLVEGAVDFVRHFVQAGKPIAAICHGPQLLISAEGVRGRRMTCYESVMVDLRNAGAEVVDQPVVEDGNLVTSRKPADLPAFLEATLRLFRQERVRG